MCSEFTLSAKMFIKFMPEGGSISFARYPDLSNEANLISQHCFEDMAMHEELPQLCETLCCMNSQFLDQNNQSLGCESLDLFRRRERTVVNSEHSKPTEKSDSYEHGHLVQHFNPNSVQQFHSWENGSQSGFEDLC